MLYHFHSVMLCASGLQSSTTSVWTSIEEFAEYITNKYRRIKERLLKVESHVSSESHMTLFKLEQAEQAWCYVWHASTAVS